MSKWEAKHGTHETENRPFLEGPDGILVGKVGGLAEIRKIATKLNAYDASYEDLLAACQGLLWPNVPSADDVALLVRMCGTLSTQNEVMVLVEQLRAAQDAARVAIAKAKSK